MSADDHVAARTSFDVISLCAGGGGLDLGIRLALPVARTVCYVEREITEAGVLAKGIATGALDDAPIWSDLLTFKGLSWRGLVDCVAGGFPCQPHSFAGKRLGEFDPRNLWPAVARVVFDVAPALCFFENVPGIAAYYWRDIRPDLQALGYEVAEGIFSAEAVGAPHLRERLYFMAYRESRGRRECRQSPGRGGQPDGRDEALADDYEARLQAPQGHARAAWEPVAALAGGDAVVDTSGERSHDPQQRRREAPVRPAAEAGCELVNASNEWSDGQERPRQGRAGLADADRNLADPELARRQATGRGPAFDAESQPESRGRHAFPPGPADAAGWERWLRERPGTEPAVRRGSDGLAFRADQLRVLGNGVVPVVAADAFRTLAARLGVKL